MRGFDIPCYLVLSYDLDLPGSHYISKLFFSSRSPKSIIWNTSWDMQIANGNAVPCHNLGAFCSFLWLLEQRWANSVLRTEYEYEYYSSSKKWPNTNTNIIRLSKTDRIWIRILFRLPKTEYEYEYYSAPQKRPNTNTNIIRLPNNDQIRIRISFGFPKMTEYEYEYHWTL